MKRRVALIVCGMEDAVTCSRLLPHDEFKCVVVGDAASAGEAIKAERPNLVIVDDEVLKGQGVAFVAQLRNVHGLVEAPIVFVSSALSEDLALAAREAGATSVLQTPLRSSEVMGALRPVFVSPVCGSTREEGGAVEDDDDWRDEPRR